MRQLQCINGDCGGDTTGENPVFDAPLTETQHEVASNSITLKPGFHFKATGSRSFSASISPAGELIAENVYDDLGQLKEKKVGNTPSKPLQTIDYTYNVRGWLKAINNPDAALGDQLFAFGIRYNDPAYNPADRALYNGNISETYWRTANDDRRRNYRYTYDALNRITGATNTGAGEYTRYELKNVAYDKNGNITDLTRNGWQNSSNYDNMDVLDYRYNATNKLLKVIDTGNKSYGFKDGTNTNNDYTYDANGNLTSDANKGITGITYNHLNLPTRISFGANRIDYIYDASGTKLKKMVTEGSSVTNMEYAGKYIYENGSLAFFSHPEGYVTKENNAYKYVYQYKDHLGNIRLSYANIGTTTGPQLEIIEENNYYPFGLRHQGYNGGVSSLGNDVAQRWKLGNKELDESLGLGTYDFGYRNYNPEIGRWMNLDPLLELMRKYSPYGYAFNNPIYYVDFEGLMPRSSFHKTDYYYNPSGQVIYDPNVNGPEDVCSDCEYIGPTYTNPDTGTYWDRNGIPHSQTQNLDEVVVTGGEAPEAKITRDGIVVWGIGGPGTSTTAGGGIIRGTDRGRGSIEVGGSDINPLYGLIWWIFSHWFPENRKPKANETTMEQQPEEEPDEETTIVRLEEVYPYFRKRNKETIEMHTIRRYDTVINKSDADSVIKSKDSINKSKIEKARRKFNERNNK